MKKPMKSKHRIKIEFVTNDFYRYFRATVQKTLPMKICTSEYTNILDDYFTEVHRRIIEEGYTFKMPGELGELLLIKNKVKLKLDPEGNIDTKNLKINWVETEKLWNRDEESRINSRFVYYLNKHSDGNYFRYYWNKKYNKLINKAFFHFYCIRRHDRKLSKLLQEGKIKIDAFTLKKGRFCHGKK